MMGQTVKPATPPTAVVQPPAKQTRAKHVAVEKEKKLWKLDLACGQNKQQGFTGVDRVGVPGVDIVHDLEKYPWPFDDNTVIEVFVSHYLEHIHDLNAFMDELWRVMIPGGKATVIAPYYTSMRAWQDPTHVRAISEATFLYYNKGWRDAQKLDHYNIKADFDFSYGYSLTPDWQVRAQDARDFAIRHYWNVVNDIQVSLTRR